MKKFSIEILPKQKSKIAELNPEFFEDVYITHIPGSSLEDLIDTAVEVISYKKLFINEKGGFFGAFDVVCSCALLKF